MEGVLLRRYGGACVCFIPVSSGTLSLFFCRFRRVLFNPHVTLSVRFFHFTAIFPARFDVRLRISPPLSFQCVSLAPIVRV